MNNEKNTKEVKNFKTNFIVTIVLLDLITIIVLYNIMPIIQGYPPYSENLLFQEKVQTLTHIQQYSGVLIIGIILNLISMKIYMKNIYKYMNKYNRKEKMNYETILKARKDCINVPYKLTIFQFAGILILGLILNFVMLAKFFAVIKFTLMIISLASINSLLILVLSKKMLYNILESTYTINNNYELHNGYRIKNSLSLQIQIMPFIFVVLIIISLIGYSKAMSKEGNAISNYYEAYIEANESKLKNITEEELKAFLKEIPLYNENNYFFIIEPGDKNIYVSKEGGEVSSFVIDYRDFFYDRTEGRLYEKFGVDEQLYAKKIVDENNKIWYIGFKFEVIDYELFEYYIIMDIIVIVLYIILSYIWAKSMSKNTNRISKKLKEILDSEEINKDKILPIMSNDEIRRLIILL